MTKLVTNRQTVRVKSGKFGRLAKFGQPLSLYYSSIIEIKDKLTKQTVKILMRPSHLDLHCLQLCVRIYLMSEFTRFYPKHTRKIYKPNSAKYDATFTRPQYFVHCSTLISVAFQHSTQNIS